MKTLEELLTENRMPHDKSPRRNPGNGLIGLRDLCRDHVTKDTVMVEIGSYVGVSTEFFAMHCKMIYAIDPWGRINELESRDHAQYSPSDMWDDGDKIQRDFEERMAPYDNVEMIKDFSVNASEKFEDESLDLVYIDGDHGRTPVKNDMVAWWPKVKYGGVLSGHDYNARGVKRGMAAWSEETGVELPAQPRGDLGYKDRSWRIIKQKGAE